MLDGPSYPGMFSSDLVKALRSAFVDKVGCD